MDELTATITSFERRVWDALVSGDAATDSALLAAGFIGVYPDGFAGRGDHSGQLDQGPTVLKYTLDQITVRPVGADHALICYQATFKRPTSSTAEAMYVSSLWQRSKGGWINIFSQDTPAP